MKKQLLVNLMQLNTKFDNQREIEIFRENFDYSSTRELLISYFEIFAQNPRKNEKIQVFPNNFIPEMFDCTRTMQF